MILGTDFLRKRTIINLMTNDIKIFCPVINGDTLFSAEKSKPMPEFIEGTKFRYDDYPFMRDLPLTSKLGEPDFRALMLGFIIEYDLLEKKMGWVHNETYVYPIVTNPSAVPVHLSPIIYNGLDREKVETQVKEWYDMGARIVYVQTLFLSIQSLSL